MYPASKDGKIVTDPKEAAMYPASIEQTLWQGNSHQVPVTRGRFRLDYLEPKVSVPPPMIKSSGFVRGFQGRPYLETKDGKIVTDPNELRRYCPYFDQHREIIAQRVGRRIVGCISAGNYGPNPEYILFLNDPENKEPELGDLPVLFRRRDEDGRIQAGRDYYALVVWQDGSLTAEKVTFQIGEGNQGRVLRNGEDLTDQVRCVLTAPPLVWEGEVLSQEEMADRWSGDIRHLVNTPELPLPDGGCMALGEKEVLSNLRDAVAGEAVVVPLVWKPSPDEEPVPLPSEWWEVARQACRRAGYEEASSSLLRRGQFYLAPDGRTLLIRFREGVYPHNALGWDPKERVLIDLQVDGLSGRVGCTLVELARLMQEAGAHYALGLDQGADPHLAAGDFWKGSFLESRQRVSAALVFVLRAEVQSRYAWNEPVVYTPHLAARELLKAA